VRQVGLLIIDEIHLLGEERGAVLEAIVSRTRFISQYVQAESQQKQEIAPLTTRIMGLSTALANPYGKSCFIISANLTWSLKTCTRFGRLDWC
jgi:activating signal cointegrator complex subunit 3